MISRRTIFSLVMTLMVLLGIRVWILNHRDECEALMPITHQPPQSVYVESGSQTVEMPCNFWLGRQPVAVQMVCLLDLAVGVVFVLSVATDWKRRGERKRFRV